MSDTPRCDDALRQTAAKFTLGPQHVLIVELARQFERELAEARKNEARYRFLRDVAWSRGDAVLYTERYGPEDWDAAIDAAMASDP